MYMIIAVFRRCLSNRKKGLVGDSNPGRRVRVPSSGVSCCCLSSAEKLGLSYLFNTFIYYAYLLSTKHDKSRSKFLSQVEIKAMNKLISNIF